MGRMREGITLGWMTTRRDIIEGKVVCSSWQQYCGYGGQMVRHYGCFTAGYTPRRQEAILVYHTYNRRLIVS